MLTRVPASSTLTRPRISNGLADLSSVLEARESFGKDQHFEDAGHVLQA